MARITVTLRGQASFSMEFEDTEKAFNKLVNIIAELLNHDVVLFDDSEIEKNYKKLAELEPKSVKEYQRPLFYQCHCGRVQFVKVAKDSTKPVLATCLDCAAEGIIKDYRLFRYICAECKKTYEIFVFGGGFTIHCKNCNYPVFIDKYPEVAS